MVRREGGIRLAVGERGGEGVIVVGIGRVGVGVGGRRMPRWVAEGVDGGEMVGQRPGMRLGRTGGGGEGEGVVCVGEREREGAAVRPEGLRG